MIQLQSTLARFVVPFALAAAQAQAAPTLAPIPAAPAYGQVVQVQVSESQWPVYLPATRYTRRGNMLYIDFEYVAQNFGPGRPDFGIAPVDFGELPPGNYAVEARFHDIAHPDAPAQVASSGLAVAGPSDWGVFAVPQQPGAFEPVQVLVNSAAFFDPATLSASMSGNVIRVDFDYYSHAPTVWNNPPPGAVSMAAVTIGGLAPGAFRIEGWARAKEGGDSQQFFTRDVVVSRAATAIEFYSAEKDHYFVTAGQQEIARLDSGVEPGWQRTGQRFKVWLRQEDAPPGAVPVCRFYAAGPSSHFYTLRPGECEWLKRLEQQQRAAYSAIGLPFPGWGYEGIAFYSMPPQDNGLCAGGYAPVYRSFNKDSVVPNHRFTADARQRAAMLTTWSDEGVGFCSP